MLIYHLSDLHIRTGDTVKARCDEYAFVFSAFLNHLDKKDKEANKKAIVVITGDVFHNKNRLESPGIKLFYDFIKGLTARVKHVFVIRGNHDYKQWDSNEVDLITSLLIPEIDGLTYIDETCVIDLLTDFGAEYDACIGVLAIQDVLKSGNTSAKEKGPGIPFPRPIKKRMHRIALYHGSFSVNTGMQDFFKDYTVALLGDIHDQRVVVDGPVIEVKSPKSPGNKDAENGEDNIVQLLYKKRIDSSFAWGYAGSMIRQSLGEEEVGHGFLLWHLGTHLENKEKSINKSTVAAYHIQNPVELSKPALFRDLNHAQHGGMPSVESKERNKRERNENETNEENENNDENKRNKENNKMASGPEQWLKYVGSTNPGAVYIKDTHLLIPPTSLAIELGSTSSSISSKVKERVDKVSNKLQLYQNAVGAEANQFSNNAFRLVNMKWDWILCYGKGNSFDFEKLDQQITILGGQNGQGKTSFLETILISLYGVGFPSRTNKHFSSSIICHKKPKGSVCMTQVILKIAPSQPGERATMARITRQFYKQTDSSSSTQVEDAEGEGTKGKKKETKKVTNNTKLHSNTKHTLVDLFDSEKGWKNEKSGKTAVDEWICKHVGSYESFLLSCMVSQNADCDFFSMGAGDQKEMLDRAMKIDTHTKFMDLLKESRLAHQWLSDMIGARVAVSLEKVERFRAFSSSMNLALPSEVVVVVEELTPTPSSSVPSVTSVTSVTSVPLPSHNLRPRAFYEKQLIQYEEKEKGKEKEKKDSVELLKDLNVFKAKYKSILNQKVQINQNKEKENKEKGKTVKWFETELAKLPVPLPISDENGQQEENTGFDPGPYATGCECCESRKGARERRLALELAHSRRLELQAGLRRCVSDHVTLLEEKIERAEMREAALKAIAIWDEEERAGLDLERKELKEREAKREAKSEAELQRRLELQRIRDRIEENKREEEELAKWSTIKSDIDQTVANVIALSHSLDSFVAHLYTHHVIPSVVRLSNEIIALVDPNLTLEGVVAADGKRIDWTVAPSDIGNPGYHEQRPPIEKASGFQRFIAGLAVRIALGGAGLGVGAAGKQLFLDEGFTSCDSNNLAKVPDFLLALLNIYDGILLVTHLEDLKDSSSTSFIEISKSSSPSGDDESYDESGNGNRNNINNTSYLVF